MRYTLQLKSKSNTLRKDFKLISKVEKKIEMAGRPRGYPKTGGRQKGTPNKTNFGLKTKLANVLENILDEIDSKFDELALYEKMMFAAKILPYILPRQSERLNKIDFSTLSEEEQQTILDDIISRLNQAA